MLLDKSLWGEQTRTKTRVISRRESQCPWMPFNKWTENVNYKGHCSAALQHKKEMLLRRGWKKWPIVETTKVDQKYYIKQAFSPPDTLVTIWTWLWTSNSSRDHLLRSRKEFPLNLIQKKIRGSSKIYLARKTTSPKELELDRESKETLKCRIFF